MMFIELHRCADHDYKPTLFNVNTISAILKSPLYDEDKTLIFIGNTKYLVKESYETIMDLLYDNTTRADLMIFSTTEEGRKESE